MHIEQHSKRLIDEDPQKKRYLIEYIGLGPEYHKWVTIAQMGGEKEEAGQLRADYRRRRPAGKEVRFRNYRIEAILRDEMDRT